jgi:putative exosortase-associated protein (TIGR04073 family)
VVYNIVKSIYNGTKSYGKLYREEDNSMKWFIITCLSFMIISGLSISVYAEEHEQHLINSNYYSDNGIILALDKLGRGIFNTLFGVFEIPKQSVKRAIEGQNSYDYVSGGLIGIGYFIIRELAGVYEIVTFPVPIPGNYQPVMDPLMGYEPEVSLK